MYTPFKYKTKYQKEGIAKLKPILFQAVAIFRLYVEKIWKKTNYTKRHYFEWKQLLRWSLRLVVVWHAKK